MNIQYIKLYLHKKIDGCNVQHATLTSTANKCRINFDYNQNNEFHLNEIDSLQKHKL